MSINRFIIHKDKHEEFVRKFVEKASTLTYGDPSNPDTVIGPIVNKQQLDKALGFLEKLKKSDVVLELEGKKEGNIITPYVFSGVKNSDEVAQSELFAPIALMIEADSDEEAIELANDTNRGLSSSIFTSDLSKGESLALKVDAGMTHVNDQTINDAPDIPFGGTKESGMGRFGNPWVVDEFTVTKWVSIQKTDREFPF